MPEIKITSKIIPAHVRTMTAKRLIEKYKSQITWAQERHLHNLKECNLFLQPYTITFTIKKQGVWLDYKVVIPKGAVLDGSSVPNLIKAFINDDYHNGAWEAHDAGYLSEGKKVNHNGWEIPQLTRKEWDYLFAIIVKRNGAPVLQKITAYNGLRLFGWTVWNKAPSPYRFMTINA